MLPFVAMLAGCASDGDEAGTAASDPLVAMYHGTQAESLAKPEEQAEDSDEDQAELEETSNKQGPEEVKASGPDQAETQPGGSVPGPALAPRHQSLFYESAPLSDETRRTQPEPGQANENQAKQGDPLLGTYHRQITAAPLSAELRPEQSGKQAGAQAPEADQSQLRTSLHLQPQDQPPAAETKPQEPSEEGPTLVNPPEQTSGAQIWIEQVDLIEAKDQIIIGIQLNGKTAPSIYILDEHGERPMLVLDFPGVTGRGFPQRMGVPESIASAIRMANRPKKAQIVVDLIPHQNYEVQPAWIKGQFKLLVSISLLAS